MKNLTEKQSECLHYIVNNPSASIREMAKEFGVTKEGIFFRIESIKKNGFATREKNSKRSLNITDKPTGEFISFEGTDRSPKLIQVFSRKCK